LLAAEQARSLEFQKGNGNEITGKLKGLWELGGGKVKRYVWLRGLEFLARNSTEREREGKVKNIDWAEFGLQLRDSYRTFIGL
jgi:hypothetical protein